MVYPNNDRNYDRTPLEYSWGWRWRWRRGWGAEWPGWGRDGGGGGGLHGPERQSDRRSLRFKVRWQRHDWLLRDMQENDWTRWTIAMLVLNLTLWERGSDVIDPGKQQMSDYWYYSHISFIIVLHSPKKVKLQKKVLMKERWRQNMKVKLLINN